MQLSDAFKPVEFVASAPKHLLRPKPATVFGPVGRVSTTDHRAQRSTIGATAGSAFSPSRIVSRPRHQPLADRMADVIACTPDTEEDPEVARVFASLSLATSPASGRAHQRSAPLLEQTLEPTEQRVILKVKSRRWRHGQSTPGRKRLSSCPGSISPTGCRQVPPFPVHGITDTAPSAKRPCNVRVYPFEPEARTPLNSPTLKKGVRQPTPFAVSTSNVLLTEAQTKWGQVLAMDL